MTAAPLPHQRPAPGAGGAAPEAGPGRPRRPHGARAGDQGGGEAGADGEGVRGGAEGRNKLQPACSRSI